MKELKLNIKKQFVFTLLVLCMLTISNAQTNSVTGQVRDSRTWEALPDVSVELSAKHPFSTEGFSNVPMETKTDENGCFTFEKLPKADFELTISYRFEEIGTRYYKTPISTKTDKLTELNVYLPEKCDFHTIANKSGICPVCKKKDAVLKIIYGMPDQDLFEKSERGEVALGGCEIDDYCHAKWRCKRDSIDF